MESSVVVPLQKRFPGVTAPGPRDTTVQCFIKRDRTTSTYELYLCLAPPPGRLLPPGVSSLSYLHLRLNRLLASSKRTYVGRLFGNLALMNRAAVMEGKFLLTARTYWWATSTDFIISLNADDMSTASSTYVGRLRSNSLGTKFTIYDSQPPHNGAVSSANRASGRRLSSNNISPKVPAGSYNVAHIAYEPHVLGTKGLMCMQCTLHTNSGLLSKDRPLVSKNKAPRWYDQLQAWCLNFRGHVTVASVKNFQLVAATEPNQMTSQTRDHDKVLLQFGKIGKDMFTMDYRYPLSAFQAFAICLSSFDTKLAIDRRS